MAWPNNFNGHNPFWESMMSGPGGPNGRTRGAGVDRAAPEGFGNPDAWNRWAGRGGWGEDFGMGPGSRGHHGRHGGHGEGRHGSFEGRGGGGRRHGGRRHRGGPDAAGPSDNDNNNDAAPPEYSDEEGVVVDEKRDNEKDDSPDTMMREDTADAADPPEEVPSDGEGSRHRHGGRHGKRHGPCGGRRGRGGPGGFGGFGGFGPRGGPHHGPGHHGPGPHGPGPHGRGFHGPPGPPPFPFGFFGGMGEGPHGGPHHGHGHRGPRGHHHGPPPPPTGIPQLDAILGNLANNPYAQQAREFFERMQNQGNPPDAARDANNNNESSSDEEDMEVSFQPPVDLFDQPRQWVIHIAVPGAKKEDVGVNWDTDRSVLSISGVVHRPGDEAFLSSIVSSERAVGLFSREVRLPPVEGHANENGKDEVDADGIVAKMEDGVLVVTVPKVEKGWTEVRKVGIE